MRDVKRLSKKHFLTEYCYRQCKHKSCNVYVLIEEVSGDIQVIFKVAEDNVVFDVKAVNTNFFANYISVQRWLSFIKDIEGVKE